MSETVHTFTDLEILEMVQTNLEKWHLTPKMQKYLLNLIEVAKAEITREGITLDLTTLDDAQTVELYAAYLYRRRAEQSNGMPRMLRYRLNNRVFAEKAQVD